MSDALWFWELPITSRDRLAMFRREVWREYILGKFYGSLNSENTLENTDEAICRAISLLPNRR